MRVLVFLLLVGLPAVSFAFKVDAPKAQVSRPQTPKNTAVYPRTPAAASSKPVTSVTVSKPSTPVGEAVYPRTPDLGQIRPRTALGGGAVTSSPASKSGAAGTMSSSAATSMSGYKPKEAKDFKAPGAASSLGGGEAGLGGAAASAASKAGEAASTGLNALSQEKTELQSAEKAEKSVSNLRGDSALEKKAEEARRNK